MNEQANLPLLDALENERRYTAKELHDGVAQTVLQLGLQAGICRKLLERDQLEMLATELAQLESRIQVASGQVRELVQDLRPPVIDTDSPDFNDYIDYAIDVHRQRGGPPVSFQFKVEVGAELTRGQMLGLMRIVQEALLNVRKHARASQVRLTVFTEPETLYLTIADDGRGFDPSEVNARPIDKGGVGLTNLQMRTRAVGGTLTVARDTTGSGTKISVMLPL